MPPNRRGVANEQRDQHSAGPDDTATAVAAADRIQPAERGDPRHRRLLPRLVDRPPRDRRKKLPIHHGDRPERRRAPAGLLWRRGRLPRLPPLHHLPPPPTLHP